MSLIFLVVLLGIMYFKMITNFVTSFKITTKVEKNGTVDIVGIDEDNHEVFKFALTNE